MRSYFPSHFHMQVTGALILPAFTTMFSPYFPIHFHVQVIGAPIFPHSFSCAAHISSFHFHAQVTGALILPAFTTMFSPFSPFTSMYRSLVRPYFQLSLPCTDHRCAQTTRFHFHVQVTGAFIFIAIFALSIVCTIPSVLFGIGAGFIFPYEVAIPVVYFASMIGASANFVVGRCGSWPVCCSCSPGWLDIFAVSSVRW